MSATTRRDLLEAAARRRRPPWSAGHSRHRRRRARRRAVGGALGPSGIRYRGEWFMYHGQGDAGVGVLHGASRSACG
jgi:hypothetical protein